MGTVKGVIGGQIFPSTGFHFPGPGRGVGGVSLGVALGKKPRSTEGRADSCRIHCFHGDKSCCNLGFGEIEMQTQSLIGKQHHPGRARPSWPSPWCQRGGETLTQAGVSNAALHCVSAHQPEARAAGSLSQGPCVGGAIGAARRGPGAWEGEVAPGGTATPVLSCAESPPSPWARIPGPFEKMSMLGAPCLCDCWGPRKKNNLSSSRLSRHVGL